MKKEENKYLAEAKEQLEIDPMSLDENCIEQPILYLEWSERLNEVDTALQRCQHDQTAYKAEQYHKIRANMEKLGQRPTEAAIAAMYRDRG